jgi:hypothetical protein
VAKIDNRGLTCPQVSKSVPEPLPVIIPTHRHVAHESRLALAVTMLSAEEMLPTRAFPVDEDLKAQEILIEMIRRQDSAHDAETGARNHLDILGGYRLRQLSLAVVILVLDSVGIIDFDLDLQITQTCHPWKAKGEEAEMGKICNALVDV